MKVLKFVLFISLILINAHAKYTAFECSNLDKYLRYLKNSNKGVLEKHPKCNAAAIKKAYKNEANKKKWIEEIEGPYRAYFDHPSGVFRDCLGCISKAPFSKWPSQAERAKRDYVLVLSVDGGGVKGLIAAKILEHLEQKTGKRISDIFDIYVGTSTGGLISLFLNTPTETGEPAYNATDLVAMYRNLAGTIFSHSNYFRKMRGMGGVLTSRYSAKPYEQILKRYFKNVTLKQLLNPVAVTSVDIENQKPFIFNSIKAVKGKQENFFVWEAARATSAAPTFFKPFKIRLRDGEVLTLADGGVGINNPSMLGILMARELYPNAQILLVSFSTRVSQSKTDFRTRGPLGGGSLSLNKKGANLETLVGNLMDVPAENAENTTRELLGREGSVYIRIQAEPQIKDIRMDDGSKKALDALEAIAQDMIENDRELKHLRTILPSYIQLKEKEKKIPGKKMGPQTLLKPSKKLSDRS
ncbi:MAG: patatin-like phospholipase family protein [Alphaproteobacteria bacterium]